ncbi:MAG: hypothetical protein KDD38_08120 [Bdellovibrionales bacterium]|nr:hypothetical protein [Bdellovibrionales bacterium]
MQSEQQNKNNILGQVLLLAAFSLCVYIVATIGISYRGKSAAILERAWKLDIQNLKLNNKLPAYWDDIRLIEKYTAKDDNKAETWMKDVYPPIEINPNGQHKLEILFISQSENGEQKAVIQHHIINIPTGDSVWEIGRTYDLK